MRAYQECTRCLMDTSDPSISFDEKGVCNYCNHFDNVQSKYWYRGEEGKKKLTEIVNKIKAYGKGKEYDCILGLSGGVDSSYLAYLGTQLGLRILAVHVDAGWNSDMAVKNIQSICEKLKIDLITEVIDWETMQDVQRAFFRARVINQDIPQDHAFFAALYRYAVKNRIKYVLHGGNISTESVLPEGWKGYNALDKTHLKGVFKKYGEKSLKKYPLIGFWKSHVIYPFIHRLKVVSLLDYIDYNKKEALATLKEKIGWNEYGAKHHESRFTKFHQCYYLPARFGIEKGKAHLSSLIISGQLSKEQAREDLKKLYYSEKDLTEDKEYVAKKLNISMKEFEDIMNQSPGRHEDYPSEISLYKKFDRIISSLIRFRAKFRKKTA
jgi:N-acetyl sugar amidotransferase